MQGEQQNTFQEGLSLDMSIYNTKPTVLTDAFNLRIVKAGENEFILENAESNRKVAELKQNYVPLAVKAYNGIAYILSAEVDYTIPGTPTPTGRGEIGSYPSPDYQTGVMTQDYRPFQNFYPSTYTVAATATNQTIAIPTQFQAGVSHTLKIQFIGRTGTATVEVRYDGITVYYRDGEFVRNEIIETSFIPGSSEGVIELVTTGTFSIVGDIEEIPYGEFNSELFNLTLEGTVEMEIQPSYDGTVNVIFTDNKNPVRLVNSRFSVLPGDTYTLIDRTGTVDENLYNNESFDSSLNLILATDKIPKLTFNGVEAGGQLVAGQYRYYFSYVTQDGNSTDILAESFNVPVAHGMSVATTRGGSDATNKLTSFTLSNLDTSYSYLQVYYTYSYGSVSALTNAYRILVKYYLTSESITFTHTGYEDQEEIQLAELSSNLSSIGKVRSIAQIKNRLALANVTEKLYDRAAYLEHANSIQARFNPKELQSPDDLYGQLIYETTAFDGWVGGYYNHFNTYHRQGYRPGEAYGFYVAYILADGSLTPAFPLQGIDDIAGETPYGTPDYQDDGFSFSNLQNIRGVYRFPERGVIDLPMPEGGKLSILGVKFKVPDFSHLKGKGLGMVFFRSERISDCVGQGYVTPAMKLLLTNGDSWDHAKNVNGDLSTNWSEAEIQSKKVVPLVAGYLESFYNDDADEDNAHFLVGGLAVTSLDRIGSTLTGNMQGYIDTQRMSLFTDTACVNQPEAARLYSNRALYVRPLATVTGAYKHYTKRGVLQNSAFGADYSLPSLLDTTFMESVTKRDLPATTAFVNGYNDLTTGQRFSSRIGAYAADKYFYFKSLDEHYAVRLNYNSYVGLRFDTPLLNTEIQSLLYRTESWPEASSSTFIRTDSEVLVDQNGLLSPHHFAWLVNVYRQEGPRTSEQVKNIYYNIDSFALTPISERMTWEDLEGAMDDDRNIELFGGDSFVNKYYRKVYAGEPQPDNPTSTEFRKEEGFAISLIHDSDHNLALRDEEEVDATETANYGSKRTFIPYVTRLTQDFTEFRKATYKLPESAGYNKGYSVSKDAKAYTTVSVTSPFEENRYDVRIYLSAKHVNNAFQNGYRDFKGLVFEDYSKHLGQITKIVSIHDRLVMVQENGISLVPVEERGMIASTEGGGVFMDQVGVLSPIANALIENFGTRWQGAVCSTSNTVYIYDVDRGKIGRIVGQTIQNISDFNIQSYLKTKIEKYRNKQPFVLTRDIRLSYDPKIEDVVLHMYDSTCLETGEQLVVVGHLTKYDILEKVTNGQLTGEEKPNVPGTVGYFGPVEASTCQTKIVHPPTTPYQLLSADMGPSTYSVFNLSGGVRTNGQTFWQDRGYGWTDMWFWNNNGLDTTQDPYFRYISGGPVDFSLTYINNDSTDTSTIYTAAFDGIVTVQSESEFGIELASYPITTGQWLFQSQGGTWLIKDANSMGIYRLPNPQVTRNQEMSFIYQGKTWKAAEYVLDGKHTVGRLTAVSVDGFNTVLEVTTDDQYSGADESMTVTVYDSLNSQVFQTFLPSWTTVQAINVPYIPKSGFYKVVVDFGTNELISRTTSFITVEVEGSLDSYWRVKSDSYSCTPIEDYRTVCLNRTVDAETISYNEIVSKWQSFYGFKPVIMFPMFSNHYSFPFSQDHHTMWVHHHPDSRCIYYDEEQQWWFQYICNKDMAMQKIFTNIVAVQDRVYPSTVDYITDNDVVLQPVVNIYDDDILQGNAQYEENRLFLTIDVNPDSGGIADLRAWDDVVEKQIRDKYCKIRFTYPGNPAQKVGAIITKFIYSF